MNIKKIILTSILVLLSSSSAFSMQPDKASTDGKTAISRGKRAVLKETSEDANFLPMGSLSQGLKDIASSSGGPQTPEQQKKTAISSSAPAKLGKQDVQDSTFQTPIHNKQLGVPSSAPIPQKPRTQDEIYQDQQSVSKRFLAQTKRDFVSKKAHILFIDFINDYIQKKPSTLDITSLSARSRIYLLSSIINFKIKFLPSYNSGEMAYDTFKNWVFPSNNFWVKHAYSGRGIVDFTDLVPTTFKIGDFKYKFQQGPTFHQKGSGRIYGLISEDAAETYEQMFPYVQGSSEDKLKQFSSLLLVQKKDGKPISTSDKKGDQFFNGLSLLLDYEVARRLAKDDKFGTLPIINYIKFLITNLDNKPLFYKLTANKKTSLFQEEFNSSSDRISHAKNSIPQLGLSQNSEKQIRASLKYLHQSDEDSGDDYSGDDDFISPQKLKFDMELQELKAKQMQFLGTISQRYIQQLQNADPKTEDILWGGDIELGIISTLFHRTFVIHEPRYVNPPIGPKQTLPIHLWLEGGHYQNYDPATGEKTNTPPDGNCMFHAAIKAMTGSNDISIKEITALRKDVASELTDLIKRIDNKEKVVREGTEENHFQPITVELTHGNDNPLYVRFAAIFKAENRRELRNAHMDLPPGKLLQEALKLSECYQSSLPYIPSIEEEELSSQGSTTSEEEEPLPDSLTTEQEEHIKTLDGQEIVMWWADHMTEFHPDIQESYSLQIRDICDLYGDDEINGKKFKKELLKILI